MEVEAVFGFLEDEGLGAVEDFVGDFDAAVGGEAVEDDGVRRGGFQQGAVDLVGLEDGEAFGFFGFLAHADPGIGVDDVGAALTASQRVVTGVGEIEVGNLAHDAVDEFGLELVTRGGGDAESYAEAGAGDHQGAGDVVAIADVGEGEAGEFAEVFVNGHEVGHGLAGVGVIGEAVDDGDFGVGGEVFEFLVFEDTGHDGVDHAGENPRDIRNGFAGAQADFAGGDIDGVAAEMHHGGFEGDAGAE